MMRSRGRGGPVAGPAVGRGGAGPGGLGRGAFAGAQASGASGRGGFASGRGAVRGRGAGPSAAQQLLQKASTQLRGERVPVKLREEDELASYLNSLTQKTSQQTKSVNYEEYGDISISSGADPMTPRVRRTPSPATGAGSKFLKKKSQPENDSETTIKRPVSGGAYGVKTTAVHASTQDDDDDDDYAEDDFVGAGAVRSGPKFSSMSASAASRRGGAQMSSALNKATALTNKITQRSSGSAALRRTRSSLLDSDTDESFGPPVRGKVSGSKGSRPGSSSDNSVGHDGNKFIKKQEGQEVKAEVKVKGSGHKSPARSVSREARTRSPGDHRAHSSGGLLRGSSHVYLTSEEESLAEFIQGLSGSDESRGSRRQAKQMAAKSKRQASKDPSPSPSPSRRSRRQTPSPTAPSKGKGRSAFHRESPTKSVFRRRSSVESPASEVVDSPREKIMIADSISMDEPLEINLMDAKTLGRIVLTTPEPASYSMDTRKSQKKQPSPFKKSRSPSPSQKKKSKGKDKGREKADKKKKSKSSSVFESFGVQSIEDLLGGSDKEVTDESEIATEPIGTKKRHNETVSEIVTQIGSRATPKRQVSYSEDFEPSISERIGEDKGRGRLSRQASASSIATQYSDEDTGMEYTEDFASETLSVAQDSDTDRSSHYKYSDEDTESEATPRPSRDKKVVMETRNVEIQTAGPAGLNYQWFTHTGVSVLGPSLGLDNVDPTPIAATVINPDALEAMTAYSPATLVIHEMLKQQIELIKQFASAHDRLYHTLTDNNVPDYKYTTVEGTKAFIAKHRKPRLTMKQALKMVSEEMDR